MSTVDVEIIIRPKGRRKPRQDNRGAQLAGTPRIPRIARLMALAIKFQEMVDRGEVRDYADLARLGYVTRARITKRVRPLGSFESWCNVVGGILELAGLEGFLGNSETMFEQADSDAVQWEAFLLVLAEVFGEEPFRATDVFEKLATNGTFAAPDAKRLREALPDFLAEAADRTGGFFQRRLGRCFAERVGRRFGDRQVFLERADEDRKAKVQRWRVVKP
jgi:hypothetical protein